MANLLQQIIFCFLFVIQAQGCSLQTGNRFGLPSFEDTDIPGDVGGMIGTRQQAIISSYKFGCTGQDLMCGHITEWGADLHRASSRDDMRYTIDLQVWRPSPTVDDSTGTGCYSLVGNNRFTSIPLSGGVARVTPSPQDYIQFRPGDVLGFYVEEANRATDGVVVLTTPSSFTSELVWYASIAPTMATSQNGGCPYSVGSNGVLDTLTRAAPIISIDTVTFSCPPLPPMATTQPTPQPPNPTTDSEETPPTTNPVDPLTTDSTNGDIQATDSEGTGTELRVPTTSETATDLRSQGGSSNIGLIIGSAAAGVAVLTSILAIVIIVTVLLKKHGEKNKKEGYPVKNAAAVPTTTNEAYGIMCHDHSQSGVEENAYNYPKFDLHTIEAKQNEAYVTHTEFNIATEGNQAYGTNIIMTEINSAYGQVETADEYDYI